MFPTTTHHRAVRGRAPRRRAPCDPTPRALQMWRGPFLGRKRTERAKAAHAEPIRIHTWKSKSRRARTLGLDTVASQRADVQRGQRACPTEGRREQARHLGPESESLGQGSQGPGVDWKGSLVFTTLQDSVASRAHNMEEHPPSHPRWVVVVHGQRFGELCSLATLRMRTAGVPMVHDPCSGGDCNTSTCPGRPASRRKRCACM